MLLFFIDTDFRNFEKHTKLKEIFFNAEDVFFYFFARLIFMIFTCLLTFPAEFLIFK